MIFVVAMLAGMGAFEILERCSVAAANDKHTHGKTA
jgi:hypothetical protein